ncbi:CorA metal ion transporter [Entomophthora muscae]|uniref:CorA metal ion transporter n=1 Tax=Entomophthora muscae TaxID=34485 RepID=A0ACC2RS48_9FUNG|nr:CorA metal ion transporter [Entomophthora muscae]
MKGAIPPETIVVSKDSSEDSRDNVNITPTQYHTEANTSFTNSETYFSKQDSTSSLETDHLLDFSNKDSHLRQGSGNSTYGSLSSSSSAIQLTLPLGLPSDYSSTSVQRPMSPCLSQLSQNERRCYTPTISVSNSVGQPTKAKKHWASISAPLYNVSANRIAKHYTPHRATELLTFDGNLPHYPWGVEEVIYKWLQPALNSVTTSNSPATKTSFSSKFYEASFLSPTLNKYAIWVYLFNPTPSEVQSIGEAMDLHHLTIEDIVMQETRDKCELFPDYYVTAYSLSEFKPAARNSEGVDAGKPHKGSAYSILCDMPEEALLDLSEEYGSFDVCSLFNVVCDNAVVTFHYGSINFGEWLAPYLKAPAGQFEPNWINSMILNRVTGKIDAQLSMLEKQIERIDDFYLVGEDSNGDQPHYRGKGNQAVIPVRLDQLRVAVQLFEELLAPKCQMLRQLAQFIYQKVAVASPTLSITAQIFLDYHPTDPPADNWKRRNKGLLAVGGYSRPFSPMILSPRLSPTPHASSPLFSFNQSMPEPRRSLPKLSSSSGERIVTLFLNMESKVASLRVAVGHAQLVVERAFDLQRTHVDLAMTYRSIRQSNAMAELSGWTWVAGPLTLLTTLIGVNCLVPGQLAPRSSHWFEGLILSMLAIGWSFYLVARQGGVL